MDVNNLFIILALLGQLVLSVVARMIGGGWFSPIAFFALFWLVFASYPLMLAPDYPVEASGVIWIFFSSCAVVAGGLAARCFLQFYFEQKEHKDHRLMMLHLPGLNLVLLISVCLGIGSPLYLLYSQGYLNSSLLSPDYFLGVSRRFSVMRYTEGFTPPVLSRALVVFIYTAALLGGMRWLTATRFWQRLLALISLAPALSMTVILTTKASIFFALILFFSSLVAGNVFVRQGKVSIVNFLKFLFLSGLLLLVIIFVADNLRVGRLDKSIQDVWGHLKSAFAGYLAVFSHWFDNYHAGEMKFGQYTFSGLFNLLGISERKLGLYAEPTSLPMLNSNIFTMFRGLIMDFSMSGSIIILIIFGFVAEWSYTAVARREYIFIPSLIIFYTVTLWSFVVCAMNYMTIMLSIVCFSCICWFWSRKEDEYSRCYS